MMKKNKNIQIILAVLWILVIFMGYFWGHKPFNIQTAAAIGKIMLDFVLVFLVIISSGGIGRRVINATPLTGLERVALQASAGLGLFALCWLIIGVLSLFSSLVAWMVLLGSILLNLKVCVEWVRELKAIVEYWNNIRTFERVLVLIILFLIFLQILLVFAPPIKYDALSYHLQLPSVYQEAGGFIFASDNPYWGHPQMGEMLFTWMLLLFRSQTASLLSTMWGVLLLFGIAGTVQRLAQSASNKDQIKGSISSPMEWQAGLISAVVLMTGMTFRYMLGWAYVDLFTALLGWAAFVSILLAIELMSKRCLIFAGVFIGFAIGTKWTAGVFALAVFSYSLFVLYKNKTMVKGLFISLGFLILMVSPWIVKNLVFTGNPLYPYFFPTAWVDANRLQAASIGEPSTGIGQYLLLPITATWFGWDSAVGFGADIGPFLFLLAIPGLWLMRKQHYGKLIIVSISIWWLVMIFGSQVFNHLQQIRLYFVLLPIFAIAAGFGWLFFCRIKSSILGVSRLLSVLLILVLVFTVVQDVNQITQLSPLGVLLGNETEEAYLDRALGWYAPAMRSLKELGDESKVLMLWEARGYYAPRITNADPWIDNFRVDYWKYFSPELILNSWIEKGYTHVLYYKSGADRIRISSSPMNDAGWETLDDLIGSLPEPRSFGDTYLLYPLSESE